MTAVAVAFNGTRFDQLDANTNTGHWGGSGAAPSAEPQNCYQNTNCVNKLANATSFEGIDCDPGSGGLDMTGSTYPLWFVKVYVNDGFDVNATFGVAAGIGSANNAFYKYNLAGSGAKLSVYSAYPAQGGYILTAIDPNIAAWRDGSGTGSPSLTAIDWFGVQAAMINGNAKSENLAFDSIDVGTGLTLTAGTGADDPGSYKTFYEKDQDVTSNRWGVCSGNGDALSAWGLLSIGGATATEFDDTTSIVTFKDGYHSRGLVGVAVNLGNASSVFNDGALLIGAGTRNGVDANDTRPDYTVTGSSITGTFSHILRNFRDVTYNSSCDVDGADIEAHLLVQASANIENSIIRTNALTNVACLQDPTFGATTDLNNCQFIQTGAGHSIELGSGNQTLTALKFTGYGGTGGSNLVSSSGPADAAIFNDTGGAITLTIAAGGDLPSIRNGVGATTTVVADTQVTLAGLVNNTEVSVYDAGDGSEIAHVENVTGNEYAFTDSAANVVDIYIHHVNYYRADILGYIIPSDDTEIPVSQLFDPNTVNN